MGFRFRKTIRLGKYARLNISKSGVGMSVGRRGATFSVGPKGKRTVNVGIPGSGISYRTGCLISLCCLLFLFVVPFLFR